MVDPKRIISILKECFNTFVVIVLFISFSTATYAQSSIPLDTSLSDPLIVTFRITGGRGEETMTVAITDPQTKQDVIDNYYGKNQKYIPVGIIVDNRPGKGPHDKQWSWHLDPDSIRMAEVTIEVCDAVPSDVEAEIDYWVNTVKRYCPWSTRVDSIQGIVPTPPPTPDTRNILQRILSLFGQSNNEYDQNNDGKINELDFGAVYSR